MEAHEPPRVLAFAGHMIDRPDRQSPRFPAWAEHVVRERIRTEMQELSPIVGISSAACGGDIIFAEEILRQKIPLYVILPFENRGDFIRLSVAIAGEGWVKRFDSICEQATLTCFVKPGGYESPRDFENCQRAVVFFSLGYGAASRRQLFCLLLYDEEQAGDEIGGTKSFHQLCQALQIPCKVMDVVSIRNGSQVSPSTSGGEIE